MHDIQMNPRQRRKRAKDISCRHYLEQINFETLHSALNASACALYGLNEYRLRFLGGLLTK